MAEWKCDQINLKRKRRCTRNATTVTPWGDACDKCAIALAECIIEGHTAKRSLVWAIRMIAREEARHG